MRARKVLELAPPALPGAPDGPPPNLDLLRQWRQADRADARAVAPLRAGTHPQISIGAAIDPTIVEAAATAAGLAPLKQGDRSLVLMIPRLPEAPALGPLVLKHYLPGGWWDPRDACGRSKAVRSLLAARALQRRGFRVAPPLAAWSRPGCGSWLLMRSLENHEPLHLTAGRLAQPARSALLAELALCLRRLHASGVAYRDLKPSNVLVGAAPGFEFVFIDHDRNRFFARAAPRRLALRDLAAINAGLPPVVRAAERWRALALYDPQLVTRERWPSEVRPLLRESALRRHRWVARRLLGGA